jgi:uncharacterized protein (DUF1800 family)
MLKALSSERWNYTTAAHLLNRAGFGGTPAEINRLVALGQTRAVSYLVDYETIPDTIPNPAWAKPDPTRAERLRAARQASPEERRKLVRQEQQTQRQRIIELRGWWLNRMANGTRPFQEKMTLFWHGHFATSALKVRDAYLMWRQNDLFRREGMGNWLRFLIAVGKDPAMLIWLDGAQSRKQHPNENFAREVMELFTLGEGHYTEHDVIQAARALTGWSYDRVNQEFIERPYWHDRGLKTIFGQTGDFDGEDFLGMIVARPQAARFITAKLWNYFAGPLPSEEFGAVLADVFRENNHDFKPLMRTMFMCEQFYSPAIIRNDVKSPVQWLVSSVRMLERPLPPPLVCEGLTRNLGQDLFMPPNVKGWDGGLSWITTNTLLNRYNEAATLIQGDIAPAMHGRLAKGLKANRRLLRRIAQVRIGGVEVAKLFTEKERGDIEALIPALERRLLQAKMTPEQEKVLRDYLDGAPQLDDGAILGAIRLVMSTPEYQLT